MWILQEPQITTWAEPPDTRMTQTAKRKGVDISGLQARQFVVSDFDNFDLIYVMDHSNYDNVVRLARSAIRP